MFCHVYYVLKSYSCRHTDLRCVCLYAAVVPLRHQAAEPGGDALGRHPGAQRGGTGQRRAERPALGRSLGWTTAGQDGHQ